MLYISPKLTNLFTKTNYFHHSETINTCITHILVVNLILHIILLILNPGRCIFNHQILRFCPEKVVFWGHFGWSLVRFSRWSLKGGKLLKGGAIAQQMWSQKAGGLSKEGSLKAGTTVPVNWQ